MLAAALLCRAAPAQAARDDLQRIVQQQCLPGWQQRHDPAPCLRLEFAGDGAETANAGYALLHDRKGGGHFLLIPLRTLSGIESPQLLQSDVPNYFAAAWRVRTQSITGALRSAPPDNVGLAVNSRYSRGQDQLHIHIECQGAALHAALRTAAAQLSEQWTPIEIDGDTYQVRRLMGRTLQGASPFRLLATGLPGARENMAFYTLIVAGMQFRDGPGFALLARRAFLRGGERLLDSSCVSAALTSARR